MPDVETIPHESITPELILERIPGLSGPLKTLAPPGGFKKTLHGRWDGKDVAVQIHFRHDRNRLPRETEALRSVDSPHVAKLIAEFMLDVDGREVPVYLCEFIQGRTLSRVLGEDGPLSEKRVVDVGVGLTSGLEAIHAKKLVHRDIKPENIMIENSGRPVILDLGVAKHLDKTTVTAAGRQPGTLGWMAPEQYTGEVPIDRRCDLFGLGLVIFCVRTGRHPFSGSDPVSLQESILRDEPDRMPTETEGLAQLVKHLLEKKPYLRPRSATMVAAALRSLRGGS